MAKRTYWVPKGTVVKWSDVEMVLDDECNSVLIEESEWPAVQAALFKDELEEEFNS
jgi:hypothetical protein